MDAENPFAPSSLDAEADDSAERRARTKFRVSVAILLIPSLVNYYFWDRTYLAGRYAPDLVGLIRGANLLGLLILFATTALLALPLLNFAFRLILPAGENFEERWRSRWYQALWQLPAFSGAGAVLWIGWLCLFYLTDLRHFEFTMLCQLLGHTVAAIWYLPLLFEFGRLWWDHFAKKGPPVAD